MVIRHDLYEALSLLDSVSESGRSMGSVVSTNSAVFRTIPAKVIGTSRTGN